MKSSLSFVRLIYLAFAGLLILGQFQRLQLTPAIAVYGHEIVIALLFVVSLFQSNFTKTYVQLYEKGKPLILFIFSLIWSLAINASHLSENYLTPLLYFLRLLLYLSLLPSTIILQKYQIFTKSSEKFLNWIAVGLALGGLIQYLIFPNASSLTLLGWDDHLYRSFGTLFDPNFLGIMLVLGLVSVLTSKFDKPKHKIFMAAILITAMLLTYSRATYAALIAAAIIWGVQSKHFLKIAAGIALGVGILFLLPRRGGEGNRLERMASVSQRIESSQRAIALFKKAPVFGVGFNAYPIYSRQESHYDFVPSHPSSPDNSYLLILATSGIFGFASFLYAITSLVHHYRKDRLVLPSLLAVGTHALFNNTLFYPWVLVWLVLLYFYRKS